MIFQSREIFKAIINFVRAALIGFVVVFCIQICLTFISVYYKAWHEADIPYNVRTEWVLDSALRALRFRTSFGNDGSFLAKSLQKIHYKIYLSAKSNIPDDDPFWIEFWEPATSEKKIQYSIAIHNEIISNLKLIATLISKVEPFNNYGCYFFISKILTRITDDIEYINKEEEKFMYIAALEAIYPVIDDFINSKFDFYTKRYDFSVVQEIPEYFISNVLINYMTLIKLDGKEACNDILKEKVFLKLSAFIKNNNKITFFIQKPEELESLERDLNGMTRFLNKRHLKHCFNN